MRKWRIFNERNTVMINDIDNGTVNVIVALKLDSLTRSVYDGEKLINFLNTILN